MYAVVQSGGKQYRVKAGQTVRVEKLEGDKGSSVTLDKVLVLTDGDKTTIGAPFVSGASVTARIVEQHRTRKIIVFKYKSKKGVRVKNGHRQPYTALEIQSIKA
jgi:large subunit ribosomal protein L21